VAPDGAAPRTPGESDTVPDAQPTPPQQTTIRTLRLAVAADARAVAEGEPATFTVTASGPPSSDPIVAEYAFSGTARAGDDYTVPATVTTLAAGAMQARISVETLADNESEPHETISVALERALTATGEVEVDVTPATVTVAEPGTTIVSVAPTVAAEGEQAAFIVSVSGGARTGLTVHWDTADGTAAAGSDYTAVSGGTVIFGSGSTRRRTILVDTLQDQLDEEDETFEVSLTEVSPSASAVLGRATAAGTITDDDALPQLTIEDGEAAENAGSMSFRVLLAPASGRLVTVSFRTEDGIATAGTDADYFATTGTVQFAPGGPLEQRIQVAVVDDSDDEPDAETFTVRLHSPLNATLAEDEATGTITDDDDSGGVIAGPARLDIADGRAGEGDGFMVFTVTLNRPVATAVTAFYETRDGTAKTFPGTDYTKTEGGLTFDPGTTLAQTILVPILQDDEDEGAERFSVKLFEPVNAVLGDDTATGVIEDDDAPPDHGDTRADATAIKMGSPIAARLETATDVDYFALTVTGDGDLYAVTDAGRIGDPGYTAGTMVRLETATYTSSNTDNFDAASVTDVQDAVQVYVRVSGESATRYDVAVWHVAPSESDATFDIDLRYLGTEPTAAQKNAIRDAADTWERVITSGQPFRIITNSGWECDDEDPSSFGDYIDDIRIDIRLQHLDGFAGGLAFAGPCVSRPDGLPLIGVVVFDSADLGRFDSTTIRRLAVHEMAHVLGFGLSGRWHDLLGDSAISYALANPDSTTLPDTHFTGEKAIDAFDELLDGTTYGGKKVPVENDTGRYGRGGLDGHWREAMFGSELLTSTFSTSDAAQPLSKVTIAALEDLGYSVDYTQAEAYTLPATSLTTSSLLRAARAAFDEFHVGDDIRRGPVIVAEYPD
jgi:hypothetical protein